ncbi:MAG: DUF2252 domain-containing protein [Acidimicrobiia bacterium]
MRDTMTEADSLGRGRRVAPPVEHPDVATRIARGKAARKAVPRAAHGAWDPPASRPDPIALLVDQESRRVPELVPIRHERMRASPFAFYRGAAIVMASDLSLVPRSGLRVQLCGDGHLANFGGFASPERDLVFDMNDFDETFPGPFEWDLKRLATSFEIAARDRGWSAKKARELTLLCAQAYRESVAAFAGMTNLDVWYARLDVNAVIDRWSAEATPADVKRMRGLVARAETKDSLKAFSKLTEVVDGEHRIVSDPPLLVPARDLLDAGHEAVDFQDWIRERFRSYRRSLQADRRHLLENYRLVDVARKVVGVGSVGTRCWIVLLLGRDDNDPLFMQIKEAERSVLQPFVSGRGPTNAGQRVVQGQRLLQASSDILLGWFRSAGLLDGVERDYYVRQLWDWKVSPNLETMTPTATKVFAQMCGWTLARGHARSGDRVAIAAYLGTGDVFDRAIADFAAAYADQNQRDFDSARQAFAPAANAAGP